MDLQGNIRVLARVRPVLEVERNSGQGTDVTEFPTEVELLVKRDEATRSAFEFDRVFPPSSTQEQVFEGVHPLIVSVLDGFDVAIFAYGQTGSGKTFTMEGDAANPGVNTRAMQTLFELGRQRSNDINYTFTLSVLEIYNESIYDLLSDSATTKGERGRGLDIRQGAAGIIVPGLAAVEVDSMEMVTAQLEQANKARAVGSHDMNEHSSRSHMIVCIHVNGVNAHNGAATRAKLNLIDLAGSERVGKTDASGDRLKEAQNINRSLSALGDVIAALATRSKGSHIPFRNSKLTYLLQDCLSGGGKTLMFCNVSPAAYNLGETICSLNFAARCRAVELG
ncbi:P-loop containing nucleoside triphosphate hydrolase protein [Tribonema minus]|uniref:Kinesin-like protein n=1 Tax=Tribonema minus TaxID=303371 RepID=A0A835ZG01_9STRA|nr:P-loop containing nucleoside triphosphate hydrolase protein [Tribonema minus]